MVEWRYSMLESATPIYDPENPQWREVVRQAYESLYGAVGGTVVPLTVAAGGTVEPRRAWWIFSEEHPRQAGVVIGHLQATSVDPIQALYHLVGRCVVSGYQAQRESGVQSLKIVVSCPCCGNRFAPWGYIGGV